LIWVRTSVSNGNLSGKDLSVNASAIAATGLYEAKADFGSLATRRIPNQKDLFVIVYDTTGSEQWIAETGSNGDDIPEAISLDGNSIFLTGQFDGSLLGIENAAGVVSANLSNLEYGVNKVFLLSYTVSGDYRWGKIVSGDGEKTAVDIVLDADSLFIAGHILGSSLFPGEDQAIETNQSELFIASASRANGAIGWIRTITGSASGKRTGEVLHIDRNEFIYIAGSYTDSVYFPFDKYFQSQGGEDIFIACYSSKGEFLWAKSEGGTGNDAGLGACTCKQGHVFISGRYSAGFSLGDHELAFSGGTDAFAGKLSTLSCIPAKAGEIRADADRLCPGEGTIIHISLFTGDLTWQSRISGSSEWVEIAGENDSTLFAFPEDSVDYRAFVLMPGCVPDSSNILTISMIDVPSPDPGRGGEACGDTYLLQAGSSAGTGTWSLVAGPGTAEFDPEPTSDTVNITVSAHGLYSFNWSVDYEGCISDSAIEVIFQAPPESGAGMDAEYCFTSGQYQLSGTSSANGSIMWTSSGNGTFNDPSLENPAYIVNNETGEVQLIKTVTGADVCLPAADTMLLTITPERESYAGEDREVCEGKEELIINGSTSANGSILWSSSGNGTFDDPTIDDARYIFGDETGSVTLVKTVSGPGSCPSASDEMVVVIHPLPESMAGEDASVCSADNGFQIAGSSSSGGSIQWKCHMGGNFENPAAENPVFYFEDLLGDLWLIKEVISESGCGTASDSLLLNVVEMPEADAGSDRELQYTTSTFLEANEPVSGVGTWSVLSGSAEVLYPNDPGSEVFYLSVGENVFRWTVISGVCPEVWDDAIITVGQMILPTVITPNGDDFNEFLEFQSVELGLKCRLLVFNRWGNEVFVADDYQNNWNGKDHKGRDLLPGTYFYILELEDGTSVKNYIEIRK